MTATFALLACVLFGLADFGGGLLARRVPALTVVVISQALAAAALGVVVVATGAWDTASERLWFALAAGVIGPAALLCFYRALALGPMGVISPLTTLSVAVPVAVALTLGERPGAWQGAGLVVAVLGLVLASGPQRGGVPIARRTVWLTLAAAVGFGTTMVLIAEAATSLTGLFLALFVQRLCNVVVGGAALYAAGRRGGGGLPSWRGPAISGALPALAFVGLADVAANGGYALAYRLGPVTLATVLASLYPVVTAIAARAVLDERLRMIQAVGAGLTLGGTALLASG